MAEGPSLELYPRARLTWRTHRPSGRAALSLPVPMLTLPDLKHILSAERLPFSLAYFGSLALTLWFAVGIRSTIGTLIAAIVQVVALLSYFAAYMPGGLTTLRFGGQMGEFFNRMWGLLLTCISAERSGQCVAFLDCRMYLYERLFESGSTCLLFGTSARRCIYATLLKVQRGCNTTERKLYHSDHTLSK